MVCSLDDSAVDWVLEHPEVMMVLDELSLDYSCGGKSLRYLCEQRGLDPQSVLDRLLKHIAATNPSRETSSRSDAEL